MVDTSLSCSSYYGANVTADAEVTAGEVFEDRVAACEVVESGVPACGVFEDGVPASEVPQVEQVKFASVHQELQ